MYDFLLQTPLKKQWEKIGIEKRAGTVFPLFSLHSKNSAGIGEIPDLRLAVDWCKKTGNSILQILPINDTGCLPSPFNPQTSAGLNVLHLSLSDLIGVVNPEKEARMLSLKYSKPRLVDYRIGSEKLKALRRLFGKAKKNHPSFQKFTRENDYWLKDFSLFRALKKLHNEDPWTRWSKDYRKRDSKAVKRFEKDYEKEVVFWQWIQWQLFEQLKNVKEYARKNKILLKGDLPLFVSQDSADCWANPKYFKFSLVSGAPPDYFSKKGQRWGMPPYNWEEILKDNFEYFAIRLKYAENFYDIFRIDHVIGLFRTWSIPKETPAETKGRKGFFNPEKKILQVKRGETVLNQIIRRTGMLPCAEDLGTIPLFCREALRRMGIPGLDIGRDQNDYRQSAVATLSTHDLEFYPAWLEKQGKSGSKEIEKGLRDINLSPPIFSILLVFEWLFLDKSQKKTLINYRINKPGKLSKKNWAIKMPLSMESLINHPINGKVAEIIKDSGRN